MILEGCGMLWFLASQAHGISIVFRSHVSLLAWFSPLRSTLEMLQATDSAETREIAICRSSDSYWGTERHQGLEIFRGYNSYIITLNIDL